MIVLRLASPFSSSSLTAARSPSSKIGSETTYFSLAQLPRSRRRQRSLQKGKSPCTAESVCALQIGHLRIMTVLFLRSEPGYQCHSERSRPTLITDRKSTRLNSSHLVISYAVFCLKKKKKKMSWNSTN